MENEGDKMLKTIFSLPKAKKPQARFVLDIEYWSKPTVKIRGSRRKLVQMFNDLHNDPEELKLIAEMSVLRIQKQPGQSDDIFDLCHYSSHTEEFYSYNGWL